MNRTVYFDYLKLFSIFGVILIHVTAPCYGCDLDSKSLAATYVVNALGRSAVPVFLMISGAILLSREKVDVGRFYSKAFVRYCIPTVAWVLIYKLAVFADHGHDVYDFLYIFKNRNPGYHLWYMWMFLGICVSYPFVHAMVSASSRSLLLTFLGVCGAYAFVIDPASVFINRNVGQVFNVFFNEYLFYFVLGFFLEKYLEVRSRVLPWLALVYLACVLGVGLWTYYAEQVAHEFGDYPSSPHSLLVCLQAVSIFCLAKHLIGGGKQSGALGLLSSEVYGVFFVHVLFLRYMDLKMCAAFGSTASVALYYVLASLAVFGMSFVTVFVLRKVSLVRNLFP